MESPSDRTLLATSKWADPREFALQHLYKENSGHVWLGRSPIDGTPIGYSDERHVCLVANTRSGKGASIVLPNVCSWPGSLVVVDPKGENATVAAARRGNGSDYCEGMGQDVRILDPFNVVSGQDGYKAHFNPLDTLDPEHPEVIDRAAMIADSLVVVRDDAKDPFWEESARAMVKALLLHIVTWPFLDGARNLITLRDMIVRGDWIAVKSVKETGHEDIPSAQTMLWDSLISNPALNGIISGMGETYKSMMEQNPKGFDGVRQTVITQTDFLDSPGMRECLSRSDFKLSDLKTKASGMSLFLSLPQRYMRTHFRWLRMMVSLVTSEMEIVRQQPACGNPVMLMLDEFAGLERMKSIENAVAQIAGYGVKLFFILQSLEQLRAVYKDSWQTLLANTGIKVYFSINDQFSRKHISETLGETEVYREVQTASKGSGTSKTHSKSKTTSISETSGGSHSLGKSEHYSEGNTYTEGKGSSQSKTTGETRSKAKSKGGGSSDAINRGTNESHNYGTNQGRNSSYGFGGGGSQFGSSAGSNEGHSSGSSTGYSHSTNRTFNETVSISKNSSQTFGLTQNESHSHSKTTGGGTNETHVTSYSHGKTTAEGDTTSTTESNQKTTGVNQVLHHRPLITPDEIGMCLGLLDDESHPQYPGYALIDLSDKRPTVVRRCNYFQDSQFIGWYDAHPDHPEFAPPKFLQQVEVLGLPTPAEAEYPDGLIELVDKYIADEHDIALQWKYYPDQKVALDQHVADVGPIQFRQGVNYLKHVYKEIEHPNIECSPEEGNFTLQLRAPQSGSLQWQAGPNGRKIGEVKTNRRIQYAERELPAPTPLQHFFDYLHTIHETIEERKAEEKRKREERRRQEEERKRIEAEEARRRALEEEAARKRAAEAAEQERLRKEREAELERLRIERERIRAERRAAFKAKMLKLKTDILQFLKKTLKVLKYAGPPVLIIGLIAGVWYQQSSERRADQFEFAQVLTASNLKLNQLQGAPHDYSSVEDWEVRTDRRDAAWELAGLSETAFKNAIKAQAKENRIQINEWLVSSLIPQRPIAGTTITRPAPKDAYEHHIDLAREKIARSYNVNADFMGAVPLLIIGASDPSVSQDFTGQTARDIIRAYLPLRRKSAGYYLENVDFAKVEGAMVKMYELAQTRIGDNKLNDWFERAEKSFERKRPPFMVKGRRHKYFEQEFFLIDFLSDKKLGKRVSYDRASIAKMETSLKQLGQYQAMIAACELILDAIPALKKEYRHYSDYYDAVETLLQDFLNQEAMLEKNGYPIPMDNSIIR